MLLLLALACHDPAAKPADSASPPDSAPADDSAPPSDSAPPDDSDTGAPCDPDALDKIMALEHILDGLSTDCEIAWYISTLDALETERHEGPWFEELWVMDSADGQSFDVAGSTWIQTGAVPDAVYGPDGRIYLYYLEGDLEHGREVARTRSTWFRDHGLAGFGALNALVSDDGLRFEPLDGFGVEGLVRGMVADPDVITLPDGRLRMYYVGLPTVLMDETGTLGESTPRQAFYAESDDGVTWRQVGVAADGPGADPTVICFDDTTCQMVSTGLDFGTSTDGGASFAFTDADDPPGFAPEWVTLPDGRQQVLYNSLELTSPLDAMITADQGATWTYDKALVEGCLVEALSLLPKPEGGFFVYYHYWQDGLSGSDFGDHAADTAWVDPCDAVEDPREK